MLNQKKIKTFTKSKSFGNLFLSFLFILSFLLILFNKADYFVVNKIKSASTDIIVPITRIVTLPVKITSDVVNKINRIKYLNYENSRLKEEVIRLKKWQTIAFLNQRENNAYKKLLNSTTNKINVVKTASVISQSPGFYSKTITINAGIKHDVYNDLIVINERGLVGRIIDTSNNNSKILLINDQNSSVPVKTLSKNFFAIITGNNDGKYLTSSFIKDEKLPKVGDMLLTSGSTEAFPSDILVGKVIKINKNNFLALPYVDFDNLEFVQVIDKR